jgi:hypothetical protein
MAPPRLDTPALGLVCLAVCTRAPVFDPAWLAAPSWPLAVGSVRRVRVRVAPTADRTLRPRADRARRRGGGTDRLPLIPSARAAPARRPDVSTTRSPAPVSAYPAAAPVKDHPR